MKLARRLGAFASVSAIALTAGQAAVIAQDAADDDNDFFLEEVVVTGRKI